MFFPFLVVGLLAFGLFKLGSLSVWVTVLGNALTVLLGLFAIMLLVSGWRAWKSRRGASS